MTQKGTHLTLMTVVNADPFLIRPPARASEWQEAVRLLRQYRLEFNDSTCFTSFDDEMSQIEHLYASPDRLKLISIEIQSGDVAGCVAYRTWSPGIAEMKRLYVDPEFRGRRLGYLLAEAIILAAHENGFHTMILDTMTEMKSAQTLYRHLGFYTIPPYQQQDETKVVCFEKKLSDPHGTTK